MMDYGMNTLTLEEYSLGYRARLGGMLLLEDATLTWRCGWEDADTDRLELARHRKVVGEGREDSYEATWGVLFDAGREARLHGIGFDEGRTRPWQTGWVKTDISVGVSGIER
jgi:hypothetical protein